MATVALLAPSAVADLDLAQGEDVMRKLSVGLAILLIIAYALGLLFSLKTHKELFASAEHGGGRRPKSAKARNRGKWGTGGAAGAYGDLAAVR
jgi:Ca2+/H+ antiporter